MVQWIRNLPANAGDTGSIPDSKKIPYAEEQLSTCATTTELTGPRVQLGNYRSHLNEKPGHGNEDPAQPIYK